MIDRKTTTEFSDFATLDLVAPAFGHIVVIAYVTMSTLQPQRNGGALECQIVTDKIDGRNIRTPGPSVSGTVVDSTKDVEEMIWTETHQVEGGLSGFKLQCKQIHKTGTEFDANSFMMAEYYPLRY